MGSERCSTVALQIISVAQHEQSAGESDYERQLHGRVLAGGMHSPFLWPLMILAMFYMQLYLTFSVFGEGPCASISTKATVEWHSDPKIYFCSTENTFKELFANHRTPLCHEKSTELYKFEQRLKRKAY